MLTTKIDRQPTDECLIQQATISKLEQPSPYNIEMLRRWLDHPRTGGKFLYDIEANTWSGVNDGDFLAIPRPDGEVEKDGLSRLFLGKMVDVYHRSVGRLYKVSYLLF